MKLSACLINLMIIITTCLLPSESFSKTKLKDWVGTYVQKNEKGELTIEKDGKDLWIELWREFEPGEERRPHEIKHEEVYSVSVKGNTAKRLPHRGELCPNTLELESGGLKLTDSCGGGLPQIYYYRKVK